MKRKIRIAIVADSTAEWIRPYRNREGELTYGEYLLRHEEVSVDLYIRPGMTSHKALSLLWQELMGRFYDYYVFSFGINDCAPRSYPAFMADFYNRVLIPNTLFQKAGFACYRLISATKVQKLFSRLGISRPWISPRQFRTNIARIVEIVEKETDGKIVFLALPDVSERVEEILHGINTLLPEYRKALLERKSDRVSVIDLQSLFGGDEERMIPEGIHYSAAGHRLVYRQLAGRMDLDTEGDGSCAP